MYPNGSHVRDLPSTACVPVSHLSGPALHQCRAPSTGLGTEENGERRALLVLQSIDLRIDFRAQRETELCAAADFGRSPRAILPQRYDGHAACPGPQTVWRRGEARNRASELAPVFTAFAPCIRRLGRYRSSRWGFPVCASETGRRGAAAGRWHDVIRQPAGSNWRRDEDRNWTAARR